MLDRYYGSICNSVSYNHRITAPAAAAAAADQLCGAAWGGQARDLPERDACKHVRRVSERLDCSGRHRRAGAAAEALLMVGADSRLPARRHLLRSHRPTGNISLYRCGTYRCFGGRPSSCNRFRVVTDATTCSRPTTTAAAVAAAASLGLHVVT